ncbi:nucleoside hydrolase [Gluconobacter thailandicus]|uniref:nucleoside hydrolase n=1 Tax=Gluconobacter thailandicus TaxID=257438 RepID=UPI00077732E4|nr:nucleoside hydrolase [Gluconobacter thailandicus]KXV35675.1 nucleoside hydrolase [Gluconobacter thailandicus]
MFLKSGLPALLLGLASLLPLHAEAAPDPNYIIIDNDFAGPGGTNIQSVIPLLGQADKATLLGFTVVIGDGWENEAVAHLSRFLDIANAPSSIPVVPGATQPLVNSRARLLAWEKSNGKMPWKGAWRGDAPDLQPSVKSLKEGATDRKTLPETAALFLIRQVHAHPHQVTVLAGGPLTNIALAIKLDPDFASLCRRLVFMGAIVDGNLAQVTDSADYYTDFNLMFDPEAASIALEAPFPEVISVGAVANPIRMTAEIRDKATQTLGPVSNYLRQYFHPQPMWDELAAAIAVDPALITGSVTAYMDVDLTHGPNYGYAHVWPESTRPHIGERPVKIVTAVDTSRFIQTFVDAANRMNTHG